MLISWHLFSQINTRWSCCSKNITDERSLDAILLKSLFRKNILTLFITVHLTISSTYMKTCETAVNQWGCEEVFKKRFPKTD